MNSKQILLLFYLLLSARLASAQGTAFTYQGRLDHDGQPANGTYNLRFRLFQSLAGGSQVGGTLIVAPVQVSNGLFTVELNFGPGVFTSTSTPALEIGVRTNGSIATHQPLSPRQAVSATPYAMVAANLSGLLPDSQLSANIPRLNGNHNFTGNVNLTGAGNVGIGTALPVDAKLDVEGNLRLNDYDLFLRGGVDRNHGLGWYNTTKTFAGAAPDGPVLYGWAGGLLGTRAGGDKVALSWNSSQVTIPDPFALNFGSSTRQMLNLWNANYGIGVQNNTLYLRSDDNFAWFRKGSHDNNAGNPGTGGTNLMTLDFAGHLIVNAGVSVDSANANAGTHYPGLVFGFPSGETISSRRTPGGNQYGLDFYTGFQPRLSIANNGNVGIGTTAPEGARLDVEGDLRINDHDLLLRGGANNDHGIGYRGMAGGRGIDGPFIYGFNGGALGVGGPDSPTLIWDYVGNVWISNGLDTASINVRSGATINTGNGSVQFINDFVPGLNVTGGSLPGVMRFRNSLEIWPSQDGSRAGYLDVRGTDGSPTIALNGASGEATVKVLNITGGSDVAEPFQMSGAEIPKGAVVVIDDENPGRLKQSELAYDTRVAGIISGANGVNPGIALHQQGVIEGGQNVALTGRVYALADASQVPIKPGDLLTTSDVPGHAMKATDSQQRAGAILGKAMTALKEGKGYVLVLVSLQ